MAKYFDRNNVIEDEISIDIVNKYFLPVDETGRRPAYVDRAFNEMCSQLTFMSTKRTWGQARRAWLAALNIFYQILPYLAENIVAAC